MGSLRYPGGEKSDTCAPHHLFRRAGLVMASKHFREGGKWRRPAQPCSCVARPISVPVPSRSLPSDTRPCCGLCSSAKFCQFGTAVPFSACRDGKTLLRRRGSRMQTPSRPLRNTLASAAAPGRAWSQVRLGAAAVDLEHQAQADHHAQHQLRLAVQRQQLGQPRHQPGDVRASRP